jgi:transaldolase
MSKLHELNAAGQSVWLDFISRDIIDSGELSDLVADGIRGLTSNPTIFQKAFAEGTVYDEAIKNILSDQPGLAPDRLFEHLAVEDIRNAADALWPVYETSDRNDGYVSLEVSPELAHNTEGTIADALRLWKWVDRPNLMIKIPATPEGIPAIEESIAAGLNINATLMFSLADYEAVANAYLRGLDRAADPARVASVASFFVSRVDTAVDKALDEIASAGAETLKGTIAVANSKLAYARYQELFGDAFAPLRTRGGRPQRVLWASTSTKNPEYHDTLYVDELVGPNTVNTMPPDTVEAFRDHGVINAAAITTDVAASRAAIAALSSLGIDFDAITTQLQIDGVAAFADSYRNLLRALQEKAASL